MLMRSSSILALFALLSAGSFAQAAGKLTFDADIKPVFKEHCSSCHNPEKKKGDLDLSNYQALMAGGGSGEVVKPGKGEASLLYRTMAHLEDPSMPPKKPKLSDKTLALFKQWIDEGAADAVKITYEEHVRPVFKEHCFDCHNPEKKEGDLDLSTFGGVLAGASSGEIVASGSPDDSRLYTALARKTEPYMPRDRAKIPDPQIEIVGAWIRGGLLEKSTSKMLTSKPKVSLNVDVAHLGKPDGPPPMPSSPLLMDPIILTKRANAIVSIAHSPWAPLVAIAGHKQVVLYNSDNYRFLGVLPFPEGVPQQITFTRNGKFIMAGGGQGAKLGLAALWDVANGQRVTTVGEEFDEALAADISPDQSLIVLGGPGKLIKAYATADGELKYSIKKHTDWVLALAFSPDGKLLASGDRNGGVHLWEADSGQPLLDLTGHKAGVNAIAWRADSKAIASVSDDGSIRVWDPSSGESSKNWTAHNGGAMDVHFTSDGRLVSAGRDKKVRVWTLDGKQLKEFDAFGDLAMSAVFTHDAKKVVAGDYLGEVRVYDLESGKKLANLTANPLSIDRQLEDLQQKVSQLRSSADSIRSQQAAAQAQIKKAADDLVKAQQRQAELTKSTDGSKKKIADMEAKAKTDEAIRKQLAEFRKSNNAARAELVALEKSIPAQAKQLAELKQKAPAPINVDQQIADTQAQIVRLQTAKPLAQLFKAREDLAAWKAEHARAVQLLAAADEPDEKKKAQDALELAFAKLKETQSLVEKLSPKKPAKKSD